MTVESNRPIAQRVRVRQTVFAEVEPKRSNGAEYRSPLEPKLEAGREVAGWTLALTLALGPLALGLRPWPLLWSACAAALFAFAAWLPGLLRSHRRRADIRWPAYLSAALIAYAIVALLNDRSTFDLARGRLVAVANVSWLPGVVDVGNALPSVACAVAGMLAVTLVSDLSRSERWRGRLILAAAFGGMATATLGLFESTPVLSDLRELIRSSAWSDARPFGLFSHNSAATMMNLAMPLIAALALRGSRSNRRRALATACIALVACGAAANISRTGLGLCVLVASASLGVLWWPARSDKVRLRPITSIAAVGALLCLIGGTLVVVRPAVLDRFSNLGERWSTYYPRYLQSKAAIELISDAPIFGHGAGAYRMLVSETSIRGMYLAPQYRPGEPFTSTLTVMDDYLQTLVEWGVAGGILWGTLLIGGLIAGIRAFVMPAISHCRRELTLVFVATFAVFAHAVVDCPLQVPSLELTAATLVGMLWAAPRWRLRPSDPLAAFYV